jgi:hypothetical protein
MNKQQLDIAKGLAQKFDRQYARGGAFRVDIERGSPMAQLLTAEMVKAVRDMLEITGLKTHLSRDGSRFTVYREVDYLEWVATGKPDLEEAPVAVAPPEGVTIQ